MSGTGDESQGGSRRTSGAEPVLGGSYATGRRALFAPTGRSRCGNNPGSSGGAATSTGPDTGGGRGAACGTGLPEGRFAHTPAAGTEFSPAHARYASWPGG